MSSKPHPITLDFSDLPKRERRKRIGDVSAILQCGSDLWVASDETTSLERLSPIGKRCYGACETFNVSEYLKLPTSDNEEIDIEGLAFEGDHLWITGSHSLKRQKPEDEGNMEEDIAALREIVRETNPVCNRSDTSNNRRFRANGHASAMP